MLHGFPVATPGMRIGLLGGSFDPPHAGHRHISLWALRKFQLDRVWWLVSPGNPLKEQGPASLERRLAACRALEMHPKIEVSDLESRLGTRQTAAMLRRVLRMYPGVRFVWLMGADNLTQFHRWHDWARIMKNVPIGVLARPGEQVRAGLSPAAQRFAKYRLKAEVAEALPWREAPAWTLLSGRMLEISSSEIRRRGDWRR